MSLTWDEGIDKLATLKVTGVCAALVQGDIINDMMAGAKEQMEVMHTKNRSAWLAAGGKRWRAKIAAQLAYHLRCSVRHMQSLQRTSRVFTPEIVPRDPAAPNAFPDNWTFLCNASCKKRPMELVQYALDNDMSAYDVRYLDWDGDRVVRRRDKPVARASNGHVSCPQCGLWFKVRGKLARECIPGLPTETEGDILVDAASPATADTDVR